MPWISAYSLVLLVSLVALGVLIGHMRRDSRSAVVLNTLGLVIFFFAMAWTTSLGQPASGAAAAAALGAVLLTVGLQRSRAARSSRAPGQ